MENKFKAGDRVVHCIHGKGTVVRVNRSGGGLDVDVVLDSGRTGCGWGGSYSAHPVNLALLPESLEVHINPQTWEFLPARGEIMFDTLPARKV